MGDSYRLMGEGLQIATFSFCLALSTVGLLRAQDTLPEADLANPQPRKFPLDVAGYLSLRSLNDDAFYKHHYYREYAGSLFLSKKAGRWLFHSEFNANSALEFDTDGIHIVPRISHLSGKLQIAFINYN